MILHIIGTPPSDRTTFQTCSAALSEDDCLLLIEDAAYWLLPHHKAELMRLPARVVALQPDILARGIDPSGVNTVDDAGFVELTIIHDSVISWF